MSYIPAALNLSVADIERLIQDRQRQLHKLQKRRAKLQKKADQLDRQIAALGGGPGKRRSGAGGAGTRARNEVSLADTIAAIFAQAGGQLGIADITEKALASGYRSNSGNFRSVVNLNLIKDKRFENVSRGVYQLRNGAGAKTAGKAEKPKRKRAKRPAAKAKDGEVAGDAKE